MNYKMEEIVTKILENDRHARNSDGYLYIKVCEQIYGGDLSKLSVYDVLTSGDFPKTETVRRTRQMIQKDRNDLKSDRAVRKWRKQQQEKYLAYARGYK